MSVVLDIGAFETRAGFCDELGPSVVERSVAVGGRPTIGVRGLLAAAADADVSAAHLLASVWSAERLFEASAAPSIPSLFDSIVGAVAAGGFPMTMPRQRGTGPDAAVEATAVNVVLPEVWHQDRRALQRFAQLIFEGSAASALFLSRPSVATALASGRPSAIVLDAGHAQTTATCVVEGIALQRTVRSAPVGGAAVSAKLLEALSAASQLAAVEACYGPDRGCASAAVRQALVLESVHRIKERFTAVRPPGAFASRAAASRSADATAAPPPPPPLFHAPDGTPLVLAGEALQNACFEVLFQAPHGPRIGAGDHGDAFHAPQATNIARLMTDAKRQCDPEAVDALAVVVGGGTSAARGFNERLLFELKKTDLSTTALQSIRVLPAPAALPGLHCPGHMPWQGAALIASSPAFAPLWVTRQEYFDEGTGVLARKVFH